MSSQPSPSAVQAQVEAGGVVEIDRSRAQSPPSAPQSTASTSTLGDKPSSPQHIPVTVSKLADPSSPPRQSLGARLEKALMNLAPSFFSINMGTGITSILIHNLPYNAQWLQRLGIVIFVLNILVFALLAFANIIRYVRWKGLFTAVNSHLVSGLFWGCLPMGFATIVNMVAIVCVPAWGQPWARLALALWWIDVLMSIAANFGMVFMIFTRQTHTAQSVSPAFLLPIVASVVAAASGGLVANALAPFDPHLARSTVIVSYVIWGTGVPLACLVMALYVYRTAIGGIPAPAALCSVFLPLGPCGQGSFGIMQLCIVIRDLAYNYNIGFGLSQGSESILRMADAIYTGGLVTGLVLWGFGFLWYILAFAIVIDHVRKHRDFFWAKNFSVGLWAITFPIGVFATATDTLATQLDSPAFKVLGTFLSVQVTLHWLYVSVLTIYKIWDGTIFVAPELAMFQGKPPVRWQSKTVDPEK